MWALIVHYEICVKKGVISSKSYQLDRNLHVAAENGNFLSQSFGRVDFKGRKIVAIELIVFRSTSDTQVEKVRSMGTLKSHGACSSKRYVDFLRATIVRCIATLR